MTTLQSDTQKSRDVDHWAQPVSRLKVSDVPAGAINLNLDGRRVAGPLQGFGQLWQRTYRVWLAGAKVAPAQVVKDWKENYARFQPSHNHFSPPRTGIKPGEVMFIDTHLPILPGLPGILPLATGVIVRTYAVDKGNPPHVARNSSACLHVAVRSASSTSTA
jgi:hypothetical protein